MKDSTLQVRCSREEKDAWRRLAEAKGVSLAEYLRAVLNAMVSRG